MLLAAYGLQPSPLAYDQARPNLQHLAAEQSAPDAIAIFGPPNLASQAIVHIRDSGFAGELVYSRAHEPAFAERVPAELLPDIISISTWSYTLDDPASREFTGAYARAFGRLPDALGAASYDAIRLLAAAVAQGDTVYSALTSTIAIIGVQGELNPAGLSPGETSSNVIVTRLNGYGTANVVARYPDRVNIDAPQYVAELEPTIASATPAPLPSPTATGYHLRIKSEVQNVRSGPGTEYDVIGQVIQGAQARILGATVDHSWLVIDYRGQWGWLAAYLVDTFGDRNLARIIQPPATPTPEPPNEPDLLVLSASPARLNIGQSTALNVSRFSIRV